MLPRKNSYTILESIQTQYITNTCGVKNFAKTKCAYVCIKFFETHNSIDVKRTRLQARLCFWNKYQNFYFRYFLMCYTNTAIEPNRTKKLFEKMPMKTQQNIPQEKQQNFDTDRSETVFCWYSGMKYLRIAHNCGTNFYFLDQSVT